MEEENDENLIDHEEFDKYLHNFTEREQRLIYNAVSYAVDDPAGLPAHNLMIIVYKLMLCLCNEKPEMKGGG